MTIQDVKDRTVEIEKLAYRPSEAHRMEKQLWSDVLHNIANNTAEDPVLMAGIANTTGLIKFHRWFS